MTKTLSYRPDKVLGVVDVCLYIWIGGVVVCARLLSICAAISIDVEVIACLNDNVLHVLLLSRKQTTI